MKKQPVILLLLPAIFIISCNEEKLTEKPNILIINVDDMGWKDVGFMGSEFYETPNIDALVSEGMVFTNGYASAANCAPSRACLMSGKWTPRHGIYTVGSSERGRSGNRKIIPTPNLTTLGDSINTLARRLKEVGYHTAHAGKWHLSDDPLTYGFDINIGGSHAGHPGSYYPPYKNIDLKAPKDEYLTDNIMQKTIDFIRESKAPFFLYYAPYAVHTPIQGIDSLRYKFEKKSEYKGQKNIAYASMINNLDRNIGILIAFLKQTEKFNNTFIIFTSDNGGLFQITRQQPLRAGKGSYYEGGIRVPMSFIWDGHIQSGSSSDYPVSNLDFFPTLLKVVGVIENHELDGLNLLPLLIGNEYEEERMLFWHFPIYLENGNDETHDPVFRTRPGSVIRKGDWKLHQYFEDNEFELYNLANDIGEQINLLDSLPEKAQELIKQLENWQHETKAPIPLNQNPEYVLVDRAN